MPPPVAMATPGEARALTPSRPRQIRERKRSAGPLLFRLPRRFFPLLGAQKSAAGTRIKRLDRIRKQLIEIALSQTLLGLDAAFLQIFP